MSKLQVGWLALSLASLWGCARETAQPDGSGTIECTQVELSSKVPGTLLQLPPQEGDTVARGDLVAQIDPADYQLRLDEARASLAHAQAQLDLMVRGSREEDIQRARDQVREAEAASRAAEADLKRIEEVFAKKSATQKQLDDARAASDRTKASLSGAEQGLARLLRGNREEEIRMAQAMVELAKVRVAQAEKAVADCTLFSPLDGVITTRAREEGEFVGQGTPLVTVSRMDEVWLSIYLSETRLGRVKMGQKVRVKIDGRSDVFHGVVTFVSPEAEFTPRNVQTPDERAKLVYRVKVTLPNPDGVFKPGMPADGYLEGA